MSDTLSLRLGGRDYRVRRFTLGQLRRLFSGPSAGGEFGFDVLRLALERAEPAVETPDALEISVDEFRIAVRQVLEFSGMVAAGSAVLGERPAEAPTGP
jgi:hypothetical protein